MYIGDSGSGQTGTTGGNTGGSTPTSPPPEMEPCKTGDPVMDSPQVQAGLKEIWTRSNPSGALPERRERGGWIIAGSSGYIFQPWPDSWTIGPCGIDTPPGITPPSGAVAWAHTHPYRRGERLTGCESLTLTVGGQAITVYQTYHNQPSDYDGDASITWGLPGYVIDKEKITEFVGNAASQDRLTIVEQVSRCGY